MRLKSLRLSNFQCFGPAPTSIDFADVTYLLGPNGSGKTAALQALARMFAFDPALRRVRKGDFHRPNAASAAQEAATLWLEATFIFPEADDPAKGSAAIPTFFAHMRLEAPGEPLQIRIRMTATIDEVEDIEEKIEYVLETDEFDEPEKIAAMDRSGRNAIQVHYLPARRDPGSQVTYAATSLLGRLLRSADWTEERQQVVEHTRAISDLLGANPAVEGFGSHLSAWWAQLHKGAYFSQPTVSFDRGEIDGLMRHLSVAFSPGHGEDAVDFARLSDGQQSLLYISLILASQSVAQAVLNGSVQGFDPHKLRPAAFSLLLLEEPENSLSPQFIGRVIEAITSFAAQGHGQAVVASHSPALLRRVDPLNIRYLRLDSQRCTQVRRITLPPVSDEACKYVREAVQAHPELYFARLVVLGEGDSEEIVLPRFMEAKGIGADAVSVCVAPLGGRHVNHFWRLLTDLDIEHVTLLDLDLARYGGGWGRIKYVLQQIVAFPKISDKVNAETLNGFWTWDHAEFLFKSEQGPKWISWLETVNVFFSSPLDLDFAMLRAYSAAYEVGKTDLAQPDEQTVAAVLGKSHGDVEHQYAPIARSYFDAYYRRFKLQSKPAHHLEALATLDNGKLLAGMPKEINRMLDRVIDKLSKLPE